MNRLTLKLSISLIVINFIILSFITIQAAEFNGQALSWLTYNNDKPRRTALGIRYIPAVSKSKNLLENYELDFECSINAYQAVQFYSVNDYSTNNKAKLYRCWLRFTSDQFEVRIGLQKINFGSASMLRPLMWFDKIDPRDPLKLTVGVYGVLGRYYFLNNANIWLWGLYGNDDIKGWEAIPSNKNKPEFGGRIQVPFLNGEIAVSYHQRQSNTKETYNDEFNSNKDYIAEKKIGIDGKWDYGIGCWLEGVIINQDIEEKKYQYQKMVTLGQDYTFELGNGLTVINEFFILDISADIMKFNEGFAFSVLSLKYPVNIIDNVSAMIYYNWENNNLYRFINWQRLYDRWSIYFIGFWNPEQFQIYQNTQDNNIFAGKGLQIILVFNH